MSLPAWLAPLTDAQQQRDLDRWAIEERGTPGLELMERAGRGLARVCTERAPDGGVVVVCGKGNNGGDGLVVARLLREAGRDVRVLLIGERRDIQGDAKTNLERLPGPDPEPFSPARLGGSSVIVDAMFGTGFTGEPTGPVLVAIRAINQSRRVATVIACDIPSGVDASTGEVSGEAVEADATVTFHAAKPGLWISPGKSHAGEVSVIDIGIPADGSPLQPWVGLMTDAVLDTIPRRGSASTKFTAGNVVVCGGSRGLTGAPCMAAMAAMRAGAGYVTVAVPASVQPIVETKLLEVMSVGMAEVDGELAPAAVDELLERAARAQSVVLGPGLGRADETATFVRRLAHEVPVALVLDADGLNAHAGPALARLADRPAATVLTPHAGELGRLLELDSAAIGAQRLRWAREAAEIAQAIVVLKGDDTIVVEPGGRVAISPGNAPSLATAGTGDVLSGILAAHLGKKMEPFTAACAAVWVHAAAGRLAARMIGVEGVIAGDVIGMLPRVLAGQQD